MAETVSADHPSLPDLTIRIPPDAYDSSRPREKSEFLEDHREWTAPQRQQQHDLLQMVCRSCSDTEKLILIGRYYCGQTMKATGESIGLSEARISQIHKALLKRLRTPLANRQEEFLL